MSSATSAPVDVRTLAEMEREQFVALLGPVFEHTPEIAARAWEARPFASVADLHAAMCAVVRDLDEAAQLALLRAHPELGARRPMAALSVQEQRSAGLDRTDAAVNDELAALNARYRKRFGFPFVLAVRGRSPSELLAVLRARIDHTPAEERAEALEQVLRIAALRLPTIVTDPVRVTDPAHATDHAHATGRSAPATPRGAERIHAAEAPVGTDTAPGTTTSAPSTAPGDLRVDGARLLARLTELARIGATDRGGVTRPAFSAEDVAARDLVASWLRDAGMATTVDAATNLVGAPATPRGGAALVLGSHLDTVVEGGTLDGAYGVVAAVEVATVLAATGHPLAHDLRVVAFADEEGGNGAPAMLGSHAIAGLLDPADLERTDDDGMVVAHLVARAGGDPDRVATAAWRPGEVAAYLELHIEQGPVLASSGIPIGVVGAITGRRTLEITVAGGANHAGTTPMELRHDAMAAAAEVVLEVERLALDGHLRVATVGHVAASPNVRNVIAGRVALGADLRDADDDRIAAAAEALRARVEAIAGRRGVTIEITESGRIAATPCDPRIVAAVDDAANALGLPATHLPSGAGHDAQIMGAIAPVGMIFVPSRGGVSHDPAEHTDPDALVTGADVLLQTVLACDAALVHVDATRHHDARDRHERSAGSDGP